MEDEDFFMPTTPGGGCTPIQDEAEYARSRNRNNQGYQSYDATGPASPDDDQSPMSPMEEGSSQDIQSPPQSPMSNSLGPRSPDNNMSAPASPDDYGSQSQMDASPMGSGSGVGSSPSSPAGSDFAPRSRSVSPAGSMRSRSGSAMSGRSNSMSGRSRSGSRSGSGRSRSGSRSGSGRSRSVSPAGSGRSRSGSGRSRSVSPAGSGRSRSGSPAGSGRSRSVSPARSGRGRSRSPAGSGRSRSGSPVKRRRIRSGSGHSGSRSRSVSPTGSALGAAAGHDSDAGEEVTGARASRTADDDDSDKESAVGELIADIFGSSDEDEEFEGFGEVDVPDKAQKKEKKPVVGSDDEDDGAQAGPLTDQPPADMSSDDDLMDSMKRKEQSEDFVSDFEVMLAKKKEEMRQRRRKRKDGDIINDNDDLIVSLIKKMKEMAEEDRELNQKRMPAAKKLKMLDALMSQLRKTDMHIAFLDLGILGAMTEWLAPLPDRSLPHLKIREFLLRQLVEFPPINSELLKNSGIGKAVMYLYKHPKEGRPNKELAGKLINDWSRPIFNLTSNYKSLSREEREQRDYEQLPKKRRLNLEGGMTPHRDLEKDLSGKDTEAKPGMPGFVGRARVPQPSKKDYVIRPKWNVDEEPKKIASKKQLNKLEKHQRAFAERKKNNKQQRAVAISIEGRNMAL